MFTSRYLIVERLFLEQAEHDATGGQSGRVAHLLHPVLALRTVEETGGGGGRLAGRAVYEIAYALDTERVLTRQYLGMLERIGAVELVVAHRAAHQVFVVLLAVESSRTRLLFIRENKKTRSKDALNVHLWLLISVRSWWWDERRQVAGLIGHRGSILWLLLLIANVWLWSRRATLC